MKNPSIDLHVKWISLNFEWIVMRCTWIKLQGWHCIAIMWIESSNAWLLVIADEPLIEMTFWISFACIQMDLLNFGFVLINDKCMIFSNKTNHEIIFMCKRWFIECIAWCEILKKVLKKTINSWTWLYKDSKQSTE